MIFKPKKTWVLLFYKQIMLGYMPTALCLILLALLPISQCANKVIFISFDGFRYDYMDLAKLAGRNISALERIRDNGFQADVESVMLTLTFPSHYAMATGRTVENHGLVGNNFYDPDLNETYAYTNSEKNTQSMWFEYAGAEPLWVTNERHGGRSCVFQWVGSEARVQDKMAFATAGVYKSTYSLRWRVDRIMDWISRDEFNLAMLYYNQPDSAGHSYGPNSKEVMDQVEVVNDGVAYLLQRIEQTPSLNGKVNIIISSDHGMTQVDTKTKVIDVYDILNSNNALDARLDSSSACLGVWPNGSASNVTALFEMLNGTEHMDVYYKEDIPDRYHFKKNPRIAPVYAIAELGYLISTQKGGYSNLSKFIFSQINSLFNLFKSNLFFCFFHLNRWNARL